MSQIKKGSIAQQSIDGSAVLDIMPQKLFEFADIGDTVVVSVGDFKSEMLLSGRIGGTLFTAESDKKSLTDRQRFFITLFCDKSRSASPVPQTTHTRSLSEIR